MSPRESRDRLVGVVGVDVCIVNYDTQTFFH